MKNSIKAVLMALGLVVFTGPGSVWAALEDTVSVTIRIQSLSVTIAEATFDFGAAQLNQSVVSTALNVTNDGNVQERFALRANNTGTNPWTMSNTNGAHTAVLYALFRADAEGTPATGLFAVNTDTVPVNSKEVPNGGNDASPFCDSAACDGENVAAAGPRDLHLMVLTPLSETSTAGTVQTMYVTITALVD